VHSELATGGFILLESGPGVRDLSDSLPALQHGVSPAYPEALRAAGINGRVSLEFVIDSTGRAVVESVVIRASDHPAFTVAAQRAILDSRYRPARRGGRALAARVQQEVVFAAH
jgi:TonB family protein